MSRSRRQPDKAMQTWVERADDGTVVGAAIGNDFSNGRRGMAKAARGAKKFVRSRIRAKNKQLLQNGFYTEN